MIDDMRRRYANLIDPNVTAAATPQGMMINNAVEAVQQPTPRAKLAGMIDPSMGKILDDGAIDRQFDGNQANGPKPGAGIPKAWSNLTTPVGNDTGLFTYAQKGILGATGLNPEAGDEQRNSPSFGGMAHNTMAGLLRMPGEVYQSADRLHQATTGYGITGTPRAQNAMRDGELGGYNALPDTLNVAGTLPMGGLLSAGVRGGESVGMAGGKLTHGNGPQMSAGTSVEAAKQNLAKVYADIQSKNSSLKDSSKWDWSGYQDAKDNLDRAYKNNEPKKNYVNAQATSNDLKPNAEMQHSSPREVGAKPDYPMIPAVLTDRGVIPGRDHSHADAMAWDSGAKKQKEGFVTRSGQFATRDEAMTMAAHYDPRFDASYGEMATPQLPVLHDFMQRNGTLWSNPATAAPLAGATQPEDPVMAAFKARRAQQQSAQ